MGILPGLKAFVAAVLGRHWQYSRSGARWFAAGHHRRFLPTAAGEAAYTDAIAFTLLILILLFKPAGLLGKIQN